jgi:hypothetical protein
VQDWCATVRDGAGFVQDERGTMQDVQDNAE